MSAERTLTRILWVWVAPIVGLSALALAFIVYYHSPRERNYPLKPGQVLHKST